MKLNIFLKTKMLFLFLVAMLMSLTIKGQALQATGGTGTLKNQIWWANFSGVSLAAGGSTSKNFTIGNLTITVNISNVSFSGARKTPQTNDLSAIRLIGYNPGTWRGDGLDNLYNIGGTGPSNTLTNALTNNISGNAGGSSFNGALISNFTVTAYATLNNKPVSLAMVYASAEADGGAVAPNNPIGVEYTQGTTNGTPWQLVEKFTNTTAGNRFIQFSNNELTALMSMGSGNEGTTEANAIPSNVAILYTGKNATSASNTLVVDAKMVSGGGSAIAIGFIVGVDGGDLPSTFGNSRNSLVPTASGGTNPNPGATTNIYLNNGTGAPTPIISAGTFVNPTNLKIGLNSADADVAVVNTSTANGDDSAGTDDEDGLDGVTIGALYPGLTSYSLGNIPVTNTTGSVAKLVGWIDFNHNGSFETNEGAESIVANGVTSASLNWSGLTGVTGGVVNIRLKLSTDIDLMTSTPTGESIDGETEDHQFVICTAGTSQVLLASSALSTCSPNTVNLNTAFTGSLPPGAGLVWFTTVNRSTPALTLAQSQAAGAGTYYAFFYDSVSNCYNTGSSTSSIAVTVNAQPSAPIIGSVTQPTCSVPTGSIELSGLPAGTWTLTDTVGGATITGTGTTATFANLAPGTHAFTVQLSSTCVSPATSFTVLNSALPPAAVILATGPTTVCPGASVVLTASPATTYQWYNTSGAIAGATNQQYVATSTGTYYIVQTENGCTSANSNSISVTVQDTVAPVFVASAGTQVVSDLIDFDTASTTAATSPANFPQSYGSGAAMVTINQSTAGTISNTSTVGFSAGTPVPNASPGKALEMQANPNVSRTNTLTFPQKIQNLKFAMSDLDGGVQIGFQAYNNGVLQNVTLTPLATTGAQVSVSNSGTSNASLIGPGGAYGASGRQAAVNVDIPGPIDSIVLVYTIPSTPNSNTNNNLITDMSFEHISNTQVAATLPVNTTVNCNAIPAAPTLLAADNCGTATVVPTETIAANTPAAGQSTITRSWTATDGSGNTTVHTQEIMVNGYSAQPTAALNQSICATNFTTLESIVITGTDIKWYADAGTSSVLPSTTVLTNGTTYYATQTVAGGCESSRVPVTVQLRNCSWINPALRFKASK